MGLGGLGILVPVAQLYPQLTAATNPMWFMGSWGSKTVLLLCLLMEFCGFCHFSWALFTVFYTVRNMVKGPDTGDEVGSVARPWTSPAAWARPRDLPRASTSCA